MVNGSLEGVIRGLRQGIGPEGGEALSSHHHRSKFCRSSGALLRDTTELLRHKTRERKKAK
jgi:hypothetical protein